MDESSTAAAEAFAKQTGLTFNPTSVSAVSPQASPEETQMYSAMPRMWEFTDNRQGTETTGMSFYAPAGTPLEGIMQRYEAKKKDWIEKERAARLQ